MSRNKDIRFMHEVTGKPYSVCRQELKAHNWNVYEAIGFDDLICNLNNALTDTVETMRCAAELAQNLTEVFRNINWTDVLKELEKQNEG